MSASGTQTLLSTNIKCDAGNTKGGLCDWIQLERCQCPASLDRAELTSASTTPYFMTVSKALSVGPLISGEYFSNRPSSSWSDERRDFAYAVISSSWDGQ